MDRVQYIRDTSRISLFLIPSFFSALIACLDATEICSVFDMRFEQEFSERQRILRRMERDMETAVQDCHHRFVRGLITTYQDLPYNKKRACAGCLVRLYTKMPGDLRQEIVDLLLNSAYIVIRRRGYEALGKDWRPTFQPMIEAAWLHHQDLECAHLVIEHFPVEYLLANLSDLEERVKRSRHLTRLYLRVGEGNPARLERLRASDGITFAYVSAKLGMKLDPEDALDLYEQYRNDQRRGLLLWCFGQMKLWSALVQIKELLDKEAEDRWGISMQIEPSTIEPE